LWPQCDFQEIEWTKTSPTTFFNVRPKKLDLDGILRNLEAAAASTTNENDPAASIAVLPELSLHHSDDLFGALTSDPDLYPEVVVAGSAHEVVDGRNANVSQTYLNGAPLLTQEKYHRLVFSADEEQLNEDIAPDLPFVVRLPSGSITRLAVSVCADLHDGNLRHELENAGVNLWLVPAMTPGLGGFAHAVSALAGANQAISLVANTVAPQKKGQVPFAVLVGMPLQDEASRHYQVPSGGMRFRGVVTLATEASSTRIHQHHWS
jgi:predicted amidohydrolase